MEPYHHTLVQASLRSGRFTLPDLEFKYGIKHNRSNKYPNLVLLKYDQIESPMGEKLVQECRGIILDEDDDWKCVARPFDKFFNHGEGHAAPIDWNNAVVQEKVDGSLITMYHYRGEWHVATSGTPDASGLVNGENFTFADLFWKTWNETVGPFDLHMMETYWTFMFELTTHFNRVVVQHPKPGITWLGTRSLVNGTERELCSGCISADGIPWPKKVREFPLRSLDDVVNTFDKMDPLKQEGYVVVDKDFNRIKVKHPGYVAIHHLRDGMSSRRLLEIVRIGESTEFLAHFPEWEPAFNEIKGRYDKLVEELEASYETIKHLESQKDFALQAVKTRYPSALFELRKGRTPSIRNYLSGVQIKNLVQNINLKEVEL